MGFRDRGRSRTPYRTDAVAIREPNTFDNTPAADKGPRAVGWSGLAPTNTDHGQTDASSPQPLLARIRGP
ncbi:uncharacterized protein ColSpa_12588 [Colletotrichum spaethianum]|uniref:Uncharacterized protein n=1 Tax=Colletotrichum spaethianum TaxID=700344 RepID=A0AA37PHU3_9PEZI|nr:uncharacterized protein ColSpa_12588 [Colletotrichum spaethianum]GKT52407.1 hypothetical protein ColSpa_12588 [Colletotrichum spaethianum]